MLRVAVFWVVFALAVAPEATLLCRVWCPDEAGVTGCHHHGATSLIYVNAGDGCDAASPSVAALTREDGRRAVSGSGAAQAIPVARYQLVPPAPIVHTVENWARGHVLDKRPLDPALRL